MANGKCDFHGGKSTGPKTSEGRAAISKANTTHGNYSKKAEALREQLSKDKEELKDCQNNLDSASVEQGERECSTEELCLAEPSDDLPTLVRQAVEDSNVLAFDELGNYFDRCKHSRTSLITMAQELQVTPLEVLKMQVLFKRVGERKSRRQDVRPFYEKTVQSCNNLIDRLCDVIEDPQTPLETSLKAGKLLNQSVLTLLQAMEKSGFRNRMASQESAYEMGRMSMEIELDAQKRMAEEYPEIENIPTRDEMLDYQTQRLGSDFGFATTADDIRHLRQIFCPNTAQSTARQPEASSDSDES